MVNYLLGIDLGSSSVKVSLVNHQTGAIVGSAHYPETEAPIKALRAGWAEQSPSDWYDYLKHALQLLWQQVNDKMVNGQMVNAVGISYQMHGLVCVDAEGKVLRDAIIWCDSRATQYGTNFTAGKLRWVKDNEPDIYARTAKIMLPGDYIAYRLTGEILTSESGFSEMYWDDALGLDRAKLPTIVPSFSMQGRVTAEAAADLGLAEGTPVTYRGGDQPNNALSLNVMREGEIAATGGTSGVVYGITTGKEADPLARINNFVHVNGLTGIMLCLNCTGILNAWMRRTVAPEGISYAEMNELMETVPVGAEGVSILPFGNGAERMLRNREVGCSIHGINFNRHTKAHLLRAAQEAIAFSFAYGIEIMQQTGVKVQIIKAGYANLFLSPLFRRTLSAVTGATIELYETDGAAGAARGAGIGAGIYKNADEAFASLRLMATEHPVADNTAYMEAYRRWVDLMTKMTK